MDWKQQIIVGSVLGGASLVKHKKGKNVFLSMRSSDDTWLQYKMQELDQLFPNKRLYQCGVTYRCNSRCDIGLTQLRESLYDQNHKVVSMDILDLLRDIGIAIWYIDGGGKTGRDKKNAYLNMTKMGEDGAAVVKDYFDSLDLTCNVNRNKERLRLVFTVPATLEFYALIGHLVPQFMRYCL